jgi:hydrogenase expression/formation protein HypE
VRSQRADGRALAAGKIPVDLLVSLLADLPPPPPEVRVGAALGEDACGIEVAGGIVVASADPITLTSEDAGRLAVLVNANDVAVSGARPRWFLAVVLVPPGSTEGLVHGLFRSIQGALDELGAHLVGGHTEVTPAVSRPIVVGQMLGLAEGDLVTTGGFAPGDSVVQVRPAPIEGAAVLAREVHRLTGLDPALVAIARSALERPGISVVEPAMLAASLGATALHDPTEGGLAAGLHEMSSAAGHRIVVEPSSVIWFPPGVAVCEALGANPWSTLASGTLLATFPPSAVDAALAGLLGAGHEAAIIGRVEEGSGVENEGGEAIPCADRDEVARLLSPRDVDGPAATI